MVSGTVIIRTEALPASHAHYHDSSIFYGTIATPNDVPGAFLGAMRKGHIPARGLSCHSCTHSIVTG